MVDRITYRISKLPAHIGEKELAGFLVQSVLGLGQASNIHVRSLAVTPDAWEDPPEKTATIEFDQPPPLLSKADQTNWRIKLSESDHYLVFDRDFLGFTPLNAVDKEDHAFDCIALSGLASHPFGSWRQRSPSAEEQFMWLRDQLAKDIPCIRIMTYGYDTKLSDSQSFQNIDDLARSFIALLKTIGAGEISAKPLIFLAHSLGGILLKRALMYLAASGDTEHWILRNVRLLVFFGVPHHGMHIDHLQTIVKARPNQILIDTLSPHSPYLSTLEEVFDGILRYQPIRLMSAYETVRSPVAELQSSGVLKRTGEPQVLVSRESAIHATSKDPQNNFQIDQDHSNMVKLACDDSAYKILRHILRDAIHNSRGQTRQAPAREAFDAISSHVRSASMDRNYKLPPSLEDDVSQSENEAPSIQSVLESLVFAEQGHRFTSIKQPHKTTFEWIFTKPEVGFLTWIQGGQGLYWIRGKPGSGKSTMFRYLQESSDLREILSSRDPHTQHLSIWYFFNERGSYLERSIEGLLRDLLHQLATSNTTLASILLEVYESQSVEDRGHWNMNEINRAFVAFMTQQLADLDITIFLDALDEVKGFPEVVSRWILDRLAESRKPDSRTKIRFCFSSREWDCFVKSFGTEPGFQLHQFTKPDIKTYVTNRLCEIPIFNKTHKEGLATSAPSIQHLLTNRANGVFLWVRMALNELARLPQTASMEDAVKLLDAVPNDLDEFYQRTISRMTPKGKNRAFVLLEIMYRSESQLTLDQLLCAEACSSGTTFTESKRLLEKHNSRVKQAKDNMRKSKTNLHGSSAVYQLDNLCGGLLECIELKARNPGGELPEPFVRFSHSTVRDFVGRIGFSALMLGPSHSQQLENGHTFLLKYLCVTMPPWRNPDVHLMFHAYKHEQTTGRPCTKFLMSLPPSFFLWSSVINPLVVMAYRSPFLFGVVAELRLFVRRYLRPENIDDTKQKFPEALNLAVWVDCNDRADFHLSRKGDSSHCKQDTGSEMVHTLLTHGFPCDIRTFGLTPFEILFCGSRTRHGLPVSQSPKKVAIAEALIQKAGCDPNSPIYVNLRDASVGTAPPWRLERKWCAIHRSHGAMLKMLLKNGADPNRLTTSGKTVLDKWLQHGISRELDLKARGMSTKGEDSFFLANIQLLVLYGAKLSKLGAKWRPSFLFSMQRLSDSARPHDMEGPRCDFTFLQEVEVLDIPIPRRDRGSTIIKLLDVATRLL